MGRGIFRGRGRYLVIAAAMLATAGCDESAAGDSTPDRSAEVPISARVSGALADLARSGMPGAQVVVSGPDGQRTINAGSGDLATGTPYADGAHFRIGSVTKTFTATVVMQLVGEGSVDLGAPIERYLPGSVRGNGNDGDRITVRQLLQHTSGLADFAPEGNSEKLPQQLDQTTDGKAYRDYTPADLVRIATSMPPQFAPGTQFRYTNTNYTLLAMLIERVTGRSFAAEVSSRIFEPLAMHDSYIPSRGDTRLRDPHPLGYRMVDGKWSDATDTEAAWTGAAGAIISTGADVNRFLIALITGKLLPAAQLAQMEDTMPMPPFTEMTYGLGLVRFRVPCGNEVKEAWGHSGGIPGFSTMAIATRTGTAATMSVNTEQTNEQYGAAFTTVFCAVA
ncbi:serine hydrolase domain-containing protein [Nocardia sp. NPDC052566]|uniref:serine hydrolase domain-containing protein n=1 Tax=Nocardia sp. NPDC052566 TaxID=3364330 RepID=UPI0037C8F1A2